MQIPCFPIHDDLANDCIMFFAVLFFSYDNILKCIDEFTC